MATISVNSGGPHEFAAEDFLCRCGIEREMWLARRMPCKNNPQVGDRFTIITPGRVSFRSIKIAGRIGEVVDWKVDGKTLTHAATVIWFRAYAIPVSPIDRPMAEPTGALETLRALNAATGQEEPKGEKVGFYGAKPESLQSYVGRRFCYTEKANPSSRSIGVFKVMALDGGEEDGLLVEFDADHLSRVSRHVIYELEKSLRDGLAVEVPPENPKPLLPAVGSRWKWTTGSAADYAAFTVTEVHLDKWIEYAYEDTGERWRTKTDAWGIGKFAVIPAPPREETPVRSECPCPDINCVHPARSTYVCETFDEHVAVLALGCTCVDDDSPGHYDSRCPMFEGPAATKTTVFTCTCMKYECPSCCPKIRKDVEAWLDMLDRDCRKQAPEIFPKRDERRQSWSPWHIVGGILEIK